MILADRGSLDRSTWRRIGRRIDFVNHEGMESCKLAINQIIHREDGRHMAKIKVGS